MDKKREVAQSAGTAALHLVFLACGVVPDDEDVNYIVETIKMAIVDW